MNYHNNLIKISDFSKLCEISRQTLIYYDRIGLFHPYYINEKGYRFYILEQYNLLYLIKNLKEHGTPLEEIKEYINNRNSKELLTLLEKNKKKIENQIKDLESISKSISYGMERLKQGEENRVGKNIPRIEIVEKDYIHVSKISVEKSGDIIRGINELNGVAERLQTKLLYVHGLVERENLKKHDFKITYFYISGDKKDRNVIEKPAGKYAVIYHQGSYDDLYKSYEKLLSFIKENNYEIKGNSYEENFLDFKTENVNNFLVKVSIFIG